METNESFIAGHMFYLQGFMHKLVFVLKS